MWAAGQHNGGVRMDLRDCRRRYLYRVELDATRQPRVVQPPGGGAEAVQLDWDRAVDDAGVLRRCPACGCRELYVRRDFPHAVGLAIVIVAGLAAAGLFGLGRVWLGLGVLAGVAGVDAVIAFFVKRCLVCYRCRSEFRDTPIGPNHESWDLAIGEKYRFVDAAGPDDRATSMDGSSGLPAGPRSLG